MRQLNFLFFYHFSLYHFLKILIKRKTVFIFQNHKQLQNCVTIRKKFKLRTGIRANILIFSQEAMTSNERVYWTPKTKCKIIVLRGSGLPYTEIDRQVNVSVTKVQKFCSQ